MDFQLKVAESFPTTVVKGKSSSKSKENNLISHIIDDLGGVLFATEMTDKTLNFASKGFPNNKSYQTTINALKGISPIVITGHKIYNSVKKFYDEKKQKYTHQRKSTQILKLIGKEHLSDHELETYDFELGREVIGWLAEKPKTTNFNIINFYNEAFEPISPHSIEKGEYYILFEFDTNKLVLEIDVVTFGTTISLGYCHLHSNIGFEKRNRLKNIIFEEFIKYFDVTKNIIEFTVKGLLTRPRMSFDYDITQFDVDKFKNEIKSAISKKKKRGYIMAGPPGVGKSTVIAKLESDINDIPIVYIAPGSIDYYYDVNNVFKFLRSISPCIAIFEDLDAYELLNKQDKMFGGFIEQMDSLKYDNCIIVIATVNEPRSIHPSLINRRGRFDKVFYIGYPSSENEIISVMKNKYKKETGKDLPVKKLSKAFVKMISDCKFTHSDLCEVIDNLLVNDMPVNAANLRQSVKSVVETMMAILKCQETDMDCDND
jgi:hypothetical protein